MGNLIKESRAAGVALILVLSVATVSNAGETPSALLTATDFSGEHVVVKTNTPAATALQTEYPNRLRRIPKAVVSLNNLHIELPTQSRKTDVSPPAAAKSAADSGPQLSVASNSNPAVTTKEVP